MLIHCPEHAELAEILDPTPVSTAGEIFIPLLVPVLYVAFGIIMAAVGHERHGWLGCLWLFFAIALPPIALLVALLTPVNVEKKRAADAKLDRKIRENRAKANRQGRNW